MDQSFGFGFGDIGGGEQSINLDVLNWESPKRSTSRQQMPPPPAVRLGTAVVLDVAPADAKAADLVRRAGCATATSIKIKPGTTKPLAAVYGKLRKRWSHVDGVLVLGPGKEHNSLRYAFVHNDHSCAPTEMLAPSPVSSLGSQSARKTPRRSPRPNKVTASGPRRPSSDEDDSESEEEEEEVRLAEAVLQAAKALAAAKAAAKAKKKRRRDGSRSSSSAEAPRRSPRKHAGSDTSGDAAMARRLSRDAPPRRSPPRQGVSWDSRGKGAELGSPFAPPPRRSPRRQAAVAAALLGSDSDSSEGEEEVVESGAVQSPKRRKQTDACRGKGATRGSPRIEPVSPASAEEVEMLRAVIESPGDLFKWNGGGPQSFQTPPFKDSSFRDDDDDQSVPHRDRPGAPSPRRLAM